MKDTDNGQNIKVDKDNVAGEELENIIRKPKIKKKGKFSVKSLFLVMSLCVVAAALAYFVMYQTGYIHVTRQLSDGSVFSGYWKMGEPFGEGVLVTTNGELIEGNWEDGVLNSGVVVAREFTYMGGAFKLSSRRLWKLPL